MALPAMAEQLVPDEVWADIAPLLPPRPDHSRGGRPFIQDRAVLGGVVYVLRAGVPWRLVPTNELGCGSRATCSRRIREWRTAGVWEQVYHRLLDWLDPPPARLTEAEARELVRRYHAGDRHPTALAREFGISNNLARYYIRNYAPPQSRTAPSGSSDRRSPPRAR